MGANFCWETRLHFYNIQSHVKMFLTYFDTKCLNDAFFSVHTAISAASPMSGASSFDTD